MDSSGAAYTQFMHVMRYLEDCNVVLMRPKKGGVFRELPYQGKNVRELGSAYAAGSNWRPNWDES